MKYGESKVEAEEIWFIGDDEGLWLSIKISDDFYQPCMITWHRFKKSDKAEMDVLASKVATALKSLGVKIK